MPYFGLIDIHGNELFYHPSYRRIDWSSIRWGINARDPRRDAPEVDYCLTNIDPISWVAKELWGQIWLAAFRELEDTTPFGGQGPGPYIAGQGDTLILRPGQLRMPISDTKWHRDRDCDPDPPPPVEPVRRKKRFLLFG